MKKMIRMKNCNQNKHIYLHVVSSATRRSNCNKKREKRKNKKSFQKIISKNKRVPSTVYTILFKVLYFDACGSQCMSCSVGLFRIFEDFILSTKEAISMFENTDTSPSIQTHNTNFLMRILGVKD